jgi:hypothetical protein
MVCFPPLTRLGAFWVLATLPTSTTFAEGNILPSADFVQLPASGNIPSFPPPCALRSPTEKKLNPE